MNENESTIAGERTQVHIEHHFPKGYNPDEDPWKSIKAYHNAEREKFAGYKKGSLAFTKQLTRRLAEREKLAACSERYFYGGIDLIAACKGMIEYVTDSDIGGNVLFTLRDLLTRIIKEKEILPDSVSEQSRKLLSRHYADDYELLSNMPEWEDGMNASQAGMTVESNPHVTDSDEWRAWNLGWKEGNEEIS